MMVPNMTIDSRKLTVEAVRKTPMRKSDGRQDGLGCVVLPHDERPDEGAETRRMPTISGEPQGTGSRPTP